MAGWKRLRPEAERASLAGDGQAEELGEIDQLLAGAAPAGFVADAHQRVLGLELVDQTAAEYRQTIDADMKRVGDIVRGAKIELE